jgi:hypothetical protein
LAHGFIGVSPWSVGQVVVGHMVRQNIVWEGMVEQRLPHGSQEVKERKKKVHKSKYAL